MSLDESESTNEASSSDISWIYRTGSDLESVLLQQPPEILKGILDFVDGFALLQLWLCGNKFLNFLVGRGGGCTYFGIDGDAAFFHMKWPKLLYNLTKLESLRIRLRVGATMGTLSGPDVASLPSCLKSIKFAFQGAEDSVCVQDTLKVGVREYINLKERFPSLQDIILDGSRSTLWENIFEVLPPTVINFQTFSHRVGPNLLQMVSADLETLRLPLAPDFNNFLALPRALTRLQLTSSLADSNIRELPRTLYTLVLTGVSTITNEGMKDLPPKLLHFVLTRCPQLNGSSFRYLPKSVVLLLIGCTGEVTLSDIRQLPPSMTSLTLTLTPLPPLELGSLPPKLCNISNAVGRLSKLDEHQLKCLPESITSLIVSATKVASEYFQALPPRLTKLVIRSVEEEIPQEAFTHIPRSLVHLEISGISGVRNDTLRLLPPTLTFLSLSQSVLDDLCFPLLPPSLTHLSLPNVLITKPVHVASLPRRLIFLTIASYLPDDDDPLPEWIPPLLRILSIGHPHIEQRWKKIIATSLSKDPLVYHPVRTIIL